LYRSHILRGTISVLQRQKLKTEEIEISWAWRPRKWFSSMYTFPVLFILRVAMPYFEGYKFLLTSTEKKKSKMMKTEVRWTWRPKNWLSSTYTLIQKTKPSKAATQLNGIKTVHTLLSYVTIAFSVVSRGIIQIFIFLL
jgi:hypothetical protein